MKKYASLNQSHTSAFYRNERSKHWMYDCHFSCNLNHMMLLGSFDLSAFVIIEDRFSVTGVFRLITNYWKSRHTINTTDALSLSVTRTHSLTQWCFKNSKSAQFKTESHQSDFMRLFRASAYTWSHTANQKGTMMTNQRNMCVALFFFCLFFYQSLVFFWYNPYHMKHYYVCENFIVICAHDVRMPNSSNSVAGVKLTKCWLRKCVSSKSSCFFFLFSRKVWSVTWIDPSYAFSTVRFQCSIFVACEKFSWKDLRYFFLSLSQWSLDLHLNTRSFPFESSTRISITCWSTNFDAVSMFYNWFANCPR